MIDQENAIQREADIAVLISHKTDFKIKKVTRHKDGHFIMIKRTIHQEDIIHINIHATKLEHQSI